MYSSNSVRKYSICAMQPSKINKQMNLVRNRLNRSQKIHWLDIKEFMENNNKKCTPLRECSVMLKFE